MKLRKRQSGETLIILPTDANRNLGIFFIFVGVTASAPLWWLWCTWFGRLPRNLHDWLPAFVMAAVGILTGFLLVVNSRKRILVETDAIRVWDGLFRKPLRFTWTSTPTIRLQQLDSELRRRPVWITKLLNERYEYTLDERAGQQLQSRALAEAIAKALSCQLRERMPDGSEMAIAAKDLDLPFRERVQRYPNLLGTAIEKPATSSIEVKVNGTTRRFIWGVATTGLFIDVIVVGVIVVLFTAIPPQPDAPSLMERARETGDYRLYLWLTLVIAAFLVLVAGFRVTLRLDPDRVTLKETLWGLPIGSHGITNVLIEEIQVTPHVRGPVVQVISDNAIFGFRVIDLDTASWLAHEIRRHLVEAPVPVASGA